MSDTAGIEARLRRLEDESAIQRLVMSYGPAADAGLATFASNLWLDDGEYDWDANGEPYRGTAGVEAMLQSANHRRLMSEGVAHFGGPLLIEMNDDTATAINYSLIMRREDQRFYLWRVSAVRWELERTDAGWRVRRRSNRLMDETGAGSQLFGQALQDLYQEDAR